MNPTREQLFGYLRTFLSGLAGYVAAKSPMLKEFLNPVFVDAVAGLLFTGALYWSHKSKTNDNQQVQPPTVEPKRPDSVP